MQLQVTSNWQSENFSFAFIAPPNKALSNYICGNYSVPLQLDTSPSYPITWSFQSFKILSLSSSTAVNSAPGIIQLASTSTSNSIRLHQYDHWKILSTHDVFILMCLTFVQILITSMLNACLFKISPDWNAHRILVKLFVRNNHLRCPSCFWWDTVTTRYNNTNTTG